MTILGFDASAILILIGVIGLIGAFLGVQLKNFSRTGLAIGSVVILGIGAYAGGYLDDFISDRGDADDDGGTGVIDQVISEGLNMEAWLKDFEAKTPIASKVVGLYENGATLIDIQSGRITPMSTATSDSNGKVIYYGLVAGDYVLAFHGDEAFDGSHYAAASKQVTLKPVPLLVGNSTTSASPDPNFYVKKIGDPYYTITATSGSNSSSGGVNQAATITEDGTGGTTVNVTISCPTDKAWLTDSAYYIRAYLDATYTDNGGANTAISLSNCNMNSASGVDIKKDSSASYYVEVNKAIMKNTTTDKNEIFSFSIWVPDLGDIDTTADTFAITVMLTFIRADTTNQTILQDTGLGITITQATG